MIGINPYNKPSNMYGYKYSIKKPVKSKVKKIKKTKREAIRLTAKSDSPGVPPNTCPYIDLVITMIKDISEAYDKMRTKGDHNPMVDKLEQQAIDMLDTYIRSSNETLRDNSAYWYEKYKELLKKQ